MNEPPDTIADALALLAERQAAAPAIHVPGRPTLTYRHLGAQIRYVRERFGDWGIQPGDIVCAALSSRPELAVAIATLPASCTFAPLDPSLPSEAYAVLLMRMKAKAVLVTSGDEHAIRTAARRLGIAEIDVTPERDAAAGLFTLAHGRGGLAHAGGSSGDPRLAYVLTSSGTTGRRKLVPLEHRAMLCYARAICEWLNFRPGDVGIHITPLYLGNGLCANLVNPLVTGQSMVCLSEGDIAGVFASIEEFRPTFLIAGFSLFQEILRRAPEFRPAIAQSCFRFLRSGSGRLDPADADRLEQLFGAPMLVGLSSTETLQITNDPLPPRRRKRGSVGLPVMNEVALLDNTGSIRASGSQGEIVVRGPTVFRGYLDDPELTAASFLGSWFRTGDLGRIDEDGYVHITGRIKEIINRGGEKISPVEIDLVIQSLPGVREAAAFGVPHPSLGEEVVAAVVREENATIDEASVVEHVRAHAGVRKVPRRVYFVARLPRTSNGKLRRSDLPQLLSQEQGFAALGSEPSAMGAGCLSPLEAALAALWSSLLQVAQVGRDDDFFLLGGDSLRGMQLIAHLKAIYGVELSIQTLFGNAATVAGMARAIDGIRAGEREPVRRSVAANRQATDGGIRPRRAQGPLPLSHTQLRMWLMEKLDQGSHAYNLTSAHRLTGSVDVAALQESLLAVVQRHEILRTTFSIVDDDPRQLVHATANVDFQCLDLAAMPESGREAALVKVIESEDQRPFDFETGPLARFRLIRLTNSHHVLLRVWHHIIADGWSAEVFEGELSVAYGARVRGKAVALPAPELHYADYAMWQRTWLTGAEGGRQLDYWREELKDLQTVDLPTDRLRPAVQSYRGTRLVVVLPREPVGRLTALGRAESATPFMTLLAAFLVLLHRYTGAEDIAVGTQIAGRRRTELKGLMGVFLNTLVLRGNLAGKPSFRELLARTRARALAAYANQDLPFEKLVEELAPSRDLSRNPLFQVSLVWQYQEAAFQLEGLQVSRLEPPRQSAKFDLTLMLRETEQGLEASWEYCTDLFERTTIERMARHFECLLRGIGDDPEQPIGDLPLLTESERRQLLVEWNDTTARYPGDRCIHQLVEEQAARTPAALAVVIADQHLTYGELDVRANQLAHHLVALGVRPEVMVGICVERSLELIVALLGILKAGGAYVPLDPSYPKERLAFMLADSQAPVLLTQQELLAHMPTYEGRILCQDRDRELISAQPRTPPPCHTQGQSLAYVIYTSGSTGTPKGVMIEQRSLLNYVLWLQREFSLAPSDRLLQSTPTNFDISILELFWPLVAGATLEVAPPGAHRSPNALIDLVQRQEITVLQVVPSMLEAVVEVAGFAKLTSLRRVFSAGEVLDAGLARRFHAQSAAELINGYGPTETTVYSTYWRCDPADIRPVVPIGRPLANTRVWILDPHGAPVPIGVPGEIHIAGDGVARGYLGRPELTAQRFVRDPFGRDALARMYRTGDRARYLPDGNIEFLGRVDHQVKLRGFRIELGEIEAVLARQPQVREAVVQLRVDTPGDPRLVAYVAAEEPPAELTERLRARLRASLPEYMVPAHFVVLEQLPLTPNGKIDRRSLPAPGYCPEEHGGSYVAARSSLEKQIAEVWCEVLKIERVGVLDNFFELGGHSLLAAQVISRLNTKLNVVLPLRRMFEAPTVAGLARDAARIGRGAGSGTDDRIPRGAHARHQ